MEGLLFFIFVIAVLAALDILANRFGADSRSAGLDDWSRSVAT